MTTVTEREREFYLPRLKHILTKTRETWGELNEEARKLMGRCILAIWEDCTKAGLDAEARKLIEEDVKIMLDELEEIEKEINEEVA